MRPLFTSLQESKTMSRYKDFKDRWDGCADCDLCESRTNMVFARGSLPCDMLFIGEAPGVSEDALGKPFVGPAGKLLDRVIEEALGATSVRLAFTNLVCCLPKGKREAGGVREPNKEEIAACSYRLEEFVNIAKPKVIVSVGKLSGKWVPKVLEYDSAQFVEIIHPAAIMRMDMSQQGLAFQRCVIAVRDAAEDFLFP